MIELHWEHAYVLAMHTAEIPQRDQENVSYMYTLPPQEHVQLSFYKPPPVIGYWLLPGSPKGFGRSSQWLVSQTGFIE
jgi:hypothetical protein